MANEKPISGPATKGNKEKSLNEKHLKKEHHQEGRSPKSEGRKDGRRKDCTRVGTVKTPRLKPVLYGDPKKMIVKSTGLRASSRKSPRPSPSKRGSRSKSRPQSRPQSHSHQRQQNHSSRQDNASEISQKQSHNAARIQGSDSFAQENSISPDDNMNEDPRKSPPPPKRKPENAMAAIHDESTARQSNPPTILGYAIVDDADSFDDTCSNGLMRSDMNHTDTFLVKKSDDVANKEQDDASASVVNFSVQSSLSLHSFPSNSHNAAQTHSDEIVDSKSKTPESSQQQQQTNSSRYYIPKSVTFKKPKPIRVDSGTNSTSKSKTLEPSQQQRQTNSSRHCNPKSVSLKIPKPVRVDSGTNSTSKSKTLEPSQQQQQTNSSRHHNPKSVSFKIPKPVRVDSGTNLAPLLSEISVEEKCDDSVSDFTEDSCAYGETCGTGTENSDIDLCDKPKLEEVADAIFDAGLICCVCALKTENYLSYATGRLLDLCS